MGRPERIKGALVALGETRQSPRLAQRADTVAASGQDLVRIGLVADVPDDPVLGGIEHVVERDRQLDHAQPRAEVPPGYRNGTDRLGPELGRHLTKIALRESPEKVRRVDTVEQRRFNSHGHLALYAKQRQARLPELHKRAATSKLLPRFAHDRQGTEAQGSVI